MLSKLKDWVTVRARYALGLPNRLPTDDRRVLEDIIIPYLVESFPMQRVLFVGCAYYTKHYDRLFGSGVGYFTIEIDPSKSRFGGRHHVVDGFENARGHWDSGFFDLIVCNGVYGWGLNGKKQVEEAFDGAYDLLRDGGLFILGWNQPESSLYKVTPQPPYPVPLTDIEALERFERHALAPLGGWRYHCEGPNRHVFDVYRRPTAQPS